MTLQDYIKLAESATDGPWDFFEVSGGLGVTHEKTADIAHCDGFHDGVRGKQEERANAQFISASRTLGPAMAKALIEAEEALKYMQLTGSKGRTEIEVSLFNKASQALATIQSLQENKNDR